MGRRSRTESVARVYIAFVERSTWSQTELASRIGVSVRALRARLEELGRAGMPLDRDEDAPHVYWSVPRGWLPDGAVLGNDDVAAALRLLARTPKTTARDRLLGKLLRVGPPIAVQPNAKEQPERDALLSTIEDAVSERVALRMHYFTASRGDAAWRHVSVQRIVYGARVRVVAVCHRSDSLKWFRVANAIDAKLDRAEPFRAAEEARVDELLRTSVDGWHGDGAIVAHRFFVRDPDARWVERNLPEGELAVERVDTGIRVTALTAGMDVIARFVVGLGASARAETPQLGARVEELARGALGAEGGGDAAARTSGGTRASGTGDQDAVTRRRVGTRRRGAIAAVGDGDDE